MEVVSPRGLNATALAPLFLLLSGCVTTGSFLSLDRPASDICRVVVAWHPEVIFSPDPVHGGQPTPGLAGRVYLFGEQIDFPRVGDGSLVVDLYPETTTGKNASSVPLEEWRIDPETLKRLKRKDAVGWGYTIFLPWATYRPEIKRVEMRVCYVPARGTPLYAQSAPLTLDSTGTANTVTMTQRTENVQVKKIDLGTTASQPAPASAQNGR